MSGDKQYVSQPLKFYKEEMAETKRFAIAVPINKPIAQLRQSI